MKKHKIIAAMTLLIIGTAATAADPCKTPVSADEILSGLRAGFEDGAPFHQAFFVGGVRGFIDIESNGGSTPSDQCQSDYVWVGVNFGDYGTSEAEAINELRLFRAKILQVEVFVDGVPLGTGLRTENRVRNNPFTSRPEPFYAYGLAGAVIEPFSPGPGIHTARIELLIEFVQGSPFLLPLERDFNVIEAKDKKSK